MKNRQTAVEFLAEATAKLGYVSIDILEQAKEMERKQIVDAHDNGYIDGANKKKTTAEQYYNETYGNKS